jgi:DNA-binding transcriptional ArsR family regulator
MVERSHPAAALDQVFHALADATRRAILRDITGREKTVGEIAEPYQMSLAAVLERADLIRRERKGSCRMVRLNATRLRAAQDWLAYYERFWSDTLDRLQQHLEAELTTPLPSNRTRSHKEK